MAFPIVDDTGLIITLSPTLSLYLDQIITLGGIPNDVQLGVITTALLLLCTLLISKKRNQGHAVRNPEDDDNILEDIPEWTVLEIIVTVLAAVTVLISIGAILISTTRVVLFVGITGLLVPPYSAFQEQKVSECEGNHKIVLIYFMSMHLGYVFFVPTKSASFDQFDSVDMKERLETREQEMNNLKHENERLEQVMKNYEKSKANLQHLPDVFEDIRKMDCASLNVLEEQLEESKQILKGMKDNKLQLVLNNVFDTLIVCDKDGDVYLSDDEIDHLIKSIEQLNKVDINDELTKRMIIDSGRSIDAVMKLAKDVLDDSPKTGSYDRDKLIQYL